MLGLGEETRVGAPPTPPWACACTMVAAGWVLLNVLLMGLATKPSARTTPGGKTEGTAVTGDAPEHAESLRRTPGLRNYRVSRRTALAAAE